MALDRLFTDDRNPLRERVLWRMLYETCARAEEILSLNVPDLDPEFRRAAGGAEPAGHVRIGYARASTVRQSLDTQLDSLKAAGVTRIFSEKISTRATTRPELDKAITLAREMRASGVAVTLVVHDHKRLGRGLDLAALAEQRKPPTSAWSSSPANCKAHTTRPGRCSPCWLPCPGWNASTSATAEGHESARARGKSIGGAGVTDDHMLPMALHLRGQELSLRDIASRLVITNGKKKGQHPSPATVLRLLREHDEATTAATSARG